MVSPTAAPILLPAVVLILWSIVMLFWMVATRMPALIKAKIPPERTVGGRGVDLNGILPPRVMWKAHNYDHLMEQPTIFYATVVILALIGAGNGYNETLAWLYVGLRIVHSLWQALVNRIPVRLVLFALSTLVLAALALSAFVTILAF
jgi:hypothetical protein